MRYRPEIDGLRAVSIIPAVFYHAGFGVAFAAIDIFFVVSGYLITTIILNDLVKDDFSLVYFYERRIRRILPALFFVLLVTLPFGWFWLMPTDFRPFSKSLVGVTTFTYNLQLIGEHGYFEPEVALKPLMALWSLSVEEQYYILFPVLLLFITSFAKRLVLPALIILFFMSLGYAEWAARNSPTAAYYLLQTRGWELMVGAFAAVYLLNKDDTRVATGIDQVLSLSGLLLMLFAFLFFDPKMIWPGLYALIPTGGAVLVILFATNGTLTKRLLSNRLLVGVGLISYSIYLWHQPIFAFYRHGMLGQTTTTGYLLLIVLSGLLAIFSYRYIEGPFRNRSIFSRNTVFAMALMAAVAFITIGSYGPDLARKYALSAEQAAYLEFFDATRPAMKFLEREGVNKAWRQECNYYDFDRYRSGSMTDVPIDALATSCIQRDPSKSHAVFLWGDSHAQMLRYGLDEHVPSDWQILQIGTFGCAPKIGFADSAIESCERSNWAAWNLIEEARPDVVIIGQNSSHEIQLMSDTAEQLLGAGVGKVIFIGPAPHWLYNLPAIVARRMLDNTPKYTWLGINEHHLELDAQLAEASKGQSLFEYVSLIDYFCNEDGCLTYVGDDSMRGLTTWDYGHLTLPASEAFVGDVLAKQIVSE